MQLRIVGYNVRSFRSGMGRVREAVAALRPDVLILQEAGSRWTLRSFAGAMGMEFVSTHRPFRRVRNAILYPPSWRLLETETGELTRQRRRIRRGFVVARLRAAGVPLTLVSTHLGLAGGERRRHARELTDHLAGIEGPLVLGVDLNEGPDGEAARWMAERLFDAFAQAGADLGETFPARSPTARIDYLFVREGAVATRAWVPRESEFETASDHRPVAADVEVPDAG